MERLTVTHHRYVLTIYGMGQSRPNGVMGLLIDGANTGLPGSNYVKVITRKSLVQSLHGETDLRRSRTKPDLSRIGVLESNRSGPASTRDA
jgi:hypothetical protein